MSQRQQALINILPLLHPRLQTSRVLHTLTPRQIHQTQRTDSHRPPVLPILKHPARNTLARLRRPLTDPALQPRLPVPLDRTRPLPVLHREMKDGVGPG